MIDRDSLKKDSEERIRDSQESLTRYNVLEPESCPKCRQPMEYYKNEEGKGFWTCQKCNLTIRSSMMASFMTPAWKKVVKFFVHGIAFSVLFFALDFLWLFSSLFLLTIGSILGFIIGILLLFVIVGVTNTVVSRFVWKFSMKYSAKKIFFHGLILFVILLVVDPVFMIPTLVFEGNPIAIAADFIVSCFVCGSIGKMMAEMWAE
jgi:ribosomal protein L37AE/L43A